jgi:peptide/nickel transport system substrate-binding protein
MTPSRAPRSRPFRPVWLTAAAVSVALAATVAGCGDGSSSSTATAPSSTATKPLRIATSFAIDSIDPLKDGFWSPEFGYGELLMRPSADGIPKPWLLQRLTRTDARTWRLQLRRGVSFHDGRPLDPDALVAVMRRQLSRSESAKAALPGATVRASGPLEVTLTTREPAATVPFVFADESTFPIYDAAAAEAAGASPRKLLAAGIYTGPYEPVSLDDRQLVMKAYPRYWGGRPPLAGVTVRFVPDAQARILAVRSGEADIAIYPPTEIKRTLDGRSDAFYVTPPEGVENIRVPLNQRSGPFADVAVRRAFSLAIDYESLAQDVMDGAYDPATGMYARQLDFAVADQRTDVAQAARLLDQAGWQAAGDGPRTKGGRPLRITLVIYPQQPDLKPLAVAVQAQLAQVGFDVRIQSVDDADTFLKQRTGWDAGLLFSGSVNFNGDPIQPLRTYLTTAGTSNYGGVHDPVLDRLVARLARTFDAAKRKALLAQVQDIVIVKNAYQVFLAVKRFPAVVGPAYRDYVPSPSLTHVTVDTRPGGA